MGEAPFSQIIDLALAPLRRVSERHRQAREALRGRLAGNPDLIPLLMKERNGHPWTEVERGLLALALEQALPDSPALRVAAVPGGIPALAWWLDRRRGSRHPRQARRHHGH